jgi:hypothetical protein
MIFRFKLSLISNNFHCVVRAVRSKPLSVAKRPNR